MLLELLQIGTTAFTSAHLWLELLGVEKQPNGLKFESDTYCGDMVFHHPATTASTAVRPPVSLSSEPEPDAAQLNLPQPIIQV